MTYDIEVEEESETPALSIRFECDPAELGEQLGEVLPRVFGYATEAGAQPSGAPFARYHSMGDGTWEIDAGVPVNEAFEGSEDIQATILPGGMVARTVHRGSYDDIGEAHEALGEWLEESEWERNGAAWDAYVDDPTEVAPDEVRTFVYWPVRKADE